MLSFFLLQQNEPNYFQTFQTVSELITKHLLTHINYQYTTSLCANSTINFDESTIRPSLSIYKSHYDEASSSSYSCVCAC
jgi:hypothetical protein